MRKKEQHFTPADQVIYSSKTKEEHMNKFKT